MSPEGTIVPGELRNSFDSESSFQEIVLMLMKNITYRMLYNAFLHVTYGILFSIQYVGDCYYHTCMSYCIHTVWFHTARYDTVWSILVVWALIGELVCSSPHVETT